MGVLLCGKGVKGWMPLKSSIRADFRLTEKAGM